MLRNILEMFGPFLGGNQILPQNPPKFPPWSSEEQEEHNLAETVWLNVTLKFANIFRLPAPVMHIHILLTSSVSFRIVWMRCACLRFQDLICHGAQADHPRTSLICFSLPWLIEATPEKLCSVTNLETAVQRMEIWKKFGGWLGVQSRWLKQAEPQHGISTWRIDMTRCLPTIAATKFSECLWACCKHEQ